LPGSIHKIDESEPPKDSAYWRALNRAEGAVTDSFPVVGSPADVDLKFLAATDTEGYLGRISVFDVKRVIGRGGMGIVLHGFDPSLHRDVAVKVLDPQLASNDVARQRFCREARAAAAVAHDNLVTVYQVDEDEGSGLPFIVMQLIAGESLEQRLRRVGKLGVHETVRLGIQCASGLAKSHATGLIHRDIKPGNILLEEGTDKAKLTDFGLARAAEDMKLTRTGFVAGTPLYMAPEQARGDDIDARADLFSLGSVMYECLTGRPPFEGRTPLAVLRRVADEAHVSLHTLNPDVPKWLEEAIDQLLAKYPDDRFQTADELTEYLEAHYVAVKNLTPTQVPVPGDCAGPKSAQRLLKKTQHKRFCVRTASTLASVFGVGLITGGVASWLMACKVYDRPAAVNSSAAAAVPGGEAAPTVGPEPLALFPSKAGSVWAVAVSPDGKTLVTGIESGRIDVWDIAERRLKYDLHPDKDRKLPAHTGPVWALDYSADGKKMVSAGDDGFLRVWDMVKGEKEKEIAIGRSVRTAAVTSTGTKVAIGDRQGFVLVFDLEAEAELLKQTTSSSVNAIKFSPDGDSLAYATSSGMVYLYDFKEKRSRISFQASQSPIYGIGFSPDGQKLVTGGWDKQVDVWDVATGTRIGDPLEHPGGVWAAQFAPCGEFVATAGQDGMTRIFDLKQGGKLVQVLHRHKGPVHALKFAAKGHQLITGGRDGSVFIWEMDGCRVESAATSR
jgi:serine/threonine protein kinase/WD40 repeat protein